MKNLTKAKQAGSRALMLLAALCFFSFAAFSQGWTTTGTVYDESGEPVIGASVMEEGTTNGTSTNVDGYFSLTVKPNAKLVISYVGMKPTTVLAKNGNITVNMTNDTQVLDDLVVIGYGVQKKSDVTGAIASVNTSDIENRTITNPQAALTGKTSGVQVVTSSGAPGSAPAIRVRGYSSNSDLSPLYVVDGIRMSDISGIDPADIESMEVLKDAASAAIYGAQAGNGVVLITTKSAKRAEAGYGTIRYDFQYANQTFGHRPKMLNANQYKDYMIEGGYYTADQITSLGWNGVTDTDWYDVAFSHGDMFKHNVTFEGANERGSFYGSIGYLTNNGPVRGDNDIYKRLTGTINADYSIKPWFKIGTTALFERYQSEGVSSNSEYGSLMTSVYTLDPLTPSVYAPDALPAWMLPHKDLLLTDANGDYYAVSNYYAGEQVHPLIMRDQQINKNTGFNVTGSVYGNLTPWKPLTITSRFGWRLSSWHNRTYNKAYYGSIAQSRGLNSISSENNQTIYYQWENFANYNQTFNEVHNVSAMAGMSFQKTVYNNTYGSAASTEVTDPETGAVTIVPCVPIPDPELWGYLNFAQQGATLGVGGIETDATQYSWFGRVGYNYDNKYMIQASLRADAYDLSKLPRSNRWGYFPAVSAGWVISQENFMGWSRPAMDFLKLRFSWGKNGSVAPLSGYAYATDIALRYNSLWPNQPAVYTWLTNNYVYTQGNAPQTMGNPDLSWEKMAQWDLGIDARFFNSRLSVGMDYYQKTTEGLLLYGIIPSLSVGGVASPMNAGKVQNSGFELDLGWQDNIGDFSYSVNFNMSTLHNKVKELHPSVPLINGQGFSNNTITLFEEGKKVWHFYGYKYLGVNQETGEAIFDDMVDGTPGLTADDKTDIGSAIPNFTYGITINLAYKGFDFTAFGSGTSGNDIFMAIQRQDKPTSNRMTDVYFKDRWVAGVNSPENPAKRPAANVDLAHYLYSDAMVFSGDFFKIRQLQLGYTVPKNITRKFFVENLRAYVSLDDFFTFTSYPGFDPEASAGTGSAQGVDMGTYPTSKKVVVGFNITF